MIRFMKIPTDYGRGPRRWFILYSRSVLPRCMADLVSVTVREALCHPFRVYGYFRRTPS